jgi:ATP-dependent RNA helicase DDX19/DBP5
MMQRCPQALDKVKVLRDMIFPQCEKLGQTIIFVRSRETAKALHAAVRVATSLTG